MININSASPQRIAALARLSQIGNDTILTFITDLAVEAKDKLVTANEMAIIHRLQGRAEAFQDLLKAVEDAVKVEAR